MGKRRDTPSRREVSEKVDQGEERMQEKEVDLDQVASDVETVRKTLESLDLGGTADGGDEVEATIEHAENATVEIFEQEDQKLEGIQDESERYQEETTDRRQHAESDMGKITEARDTILTQESRWEMEEARETALEDVKFLQEQIERAKEAAEKSERAQQEYRRRVQG